MRFSELMRVVGSHGIKVAEVRLGAAEKDPEIRGVSEDSRKVKPGDLFVARSGTKVSGAEFAADAVAKGAVAIVSTESLVVPANVAFARVENANLALAWLAHEAAGRPTQGMKMIGVTGTKGKTTVAYLMRSVLQAAGQRVGMVGTVEIDDGSEVVGAEMTTPGVVELVELFSRMKRNGVTHCVMEVSSHALHQDRVAGIDWDVGMFTNLTGDHLDYHGTMEEYAAAKALMFEGLRPTAMAVVNVDDAYGERMVRTCPAGVVRIGLEGGLRKQWTAAIEEMTSSAMKLRVKGPGGHAAGDVEKLLTTKLIGKHNAYNLLTVIAGARALGVTLDHSGPVLEQTMGAPGRLQRVDGDAGFQVFVDYAHTHDSLENVLKALRATMGTGKLICVFGCGGDRDRTKRPKMGKVAQTLADVVIVTSDNPRTEDPARIIEEVCAGFEGDWKTSKQIAVEPDRRTAIQRAIVLAEPGDVVLIAGKGHENYQIIGTTKHHFDDVEEAAAAMGERVS